MEHGTAASSGGSGHRRTTVSGPLPQINNIINREESDGHVRFSQEAMRLPWSSPSAPTTPTVPTSSNKPTGRKRSVSGSILARLSLLGSPGKDGKSPSRGDKEQLSPSLRSPAKKSKSIDDDNEEAISLGAGESSMAAALKPVKTRKRKGSLRKTALLGGRKLIEGRERKSSILQRGPLKPPPMPPLDQEATPSAPAKLLTGDLNQPSFEQDNESTTSLRSKFSYENIDANHSSDSGWSEPPAVTSTRLSLLTEHAALQSGRKESVELSSPLDLKSPASQASYASTTDDDDVLTFDRLPGSFAGQRRDSISLKKPLSSASTSYFPSVSSTSQDSLSRRLSVKKARSSPLSHNITTLSNFPEPEPHDYTETEYWGWIILFVTWLTFTVGMGSCLDIWSWAWDVGETPYAPPELEDDPTLPIVGYYPALMVLTGVVAWIWITIAWLGMKYFRHARVDV